MIINPGLPAGNVIFCDDIRHEVGGKLTIVGVYTNDMIIHESAPSRISQLGVLVRFEMDPLSIPDQLVFKILFEEDEGDESTVWEKVLALANYKDHWKTEELGSFKEENVQQFREIRVPIILRDLEFPQSGWLKIRAFQNKDEVRLGTMRVQHEPV